MNNLIILGGRKGSGKSTCGAILEKKLGYKQVSFASKLKEVVAKVYNLDRTKLEGLTEEDRKWRETPLVNLRGEKAINHQTFWEEKYKNAIQDVYGIELTDYYQDCQTLQNRTALDVFSELKCAVDKLNRYRDLTPRQLMQYVGTEVFRTISKNTWCEALGREIEPDLDAGQKFVVTDGRFENEALWGKSKGALIVFISRGLEPEYNDEHSSENLKEFEQLADVVITNNSSVEELEGFWVSFFSLGKQNLRQPLIV
jgi:hypothetical protein